MKNKQYYSISEVSKMLNIKEHIIRYWDTKLKIDDICIRLEKSKRRQFNDLNIKKLKEVQNIIKNDDKHNTVLNLTKKILNNKNKKKEDPKQKIYKNIYFDVKSLVKISDNLKELLKS